MGSGKPLEGTVILRDPASRAWLSFTQPVEVLCADGLKDVVPELEKLQQACCEGLWVAGFLSYEAAPALDQALSTHPLGPLPAAWFGVYEEVGNLPDLHPASAIGLPAWEPSIPRTAYVEAVDRVRAYIAAGDTYQVNYSYRLRSAFRGEAWALFHTLSGCAPPPLAAYVDTGRFAVCSLSPELFFERDGAHVTSRPMKGTAPRGLSAREDRHMRSRLQASQKDRAENVMIVDMVRNDLGRVARPGTVLVPERFNLESFPSVWQMTSTVTAETDAGLADLLRALFPAASITGAPKARTMQIIAELEDSPRGVYTGAIGWAGPGRRARFSVAIRTVVVDRARGEAEYGVGGGVVWDSTAEGEWRECQVKSRALVRPPPPFRLLETMRWSPDGGFDLLDEHLDRLAGSAAYFDYRFDRAAARLRLETAAADWGGACRRVRLLMDADGALTIESADLARGTGPRRIALSPDPVLSSDRFLYHKTTHREVYDRALAAFPGCDDVLLQNERGELTESCLANLVVQLDGQWVTPPVSCGLLAGTYRARMLAEGRVRERVVRVEEVAACTRILLVNSVRGEREALLPSPPK